MGAAARPSSRSREPALARRSRRIVGLLPFRAENPEFAIRSMVRSNKRKHSDHVPDDSKDEDYIPSDKDDAVEDVGGHTA